MPTAARLSLLLFLGSLLFAESSATAGMQNVRFCLHAKPAFSPTDAIPSLCDNPATAEIEPNYSPNFENLPCDQYMVNAPLGPSAVYLVVAQAGEEGVAGVGFGIYYNGSATDSDPGQAIWGIVSSQTTWTSCANGVSYPNSDGVHGDFPETGGGVRVTWNTQTSCANQVIGDKGVHAVVGCFQVYAYSSTVMSITPNNNIQGPYPEITVADCSGGTTDYYPLLGPYQLSTILARVQFGSGSGGYNPCSVTPAQPSTWGKLKGRYKR